MRNAPRTQLMHGYDDYRVRVPRTHRRRLRPAHDINNYYCKHNVGGNGETLRIVVQPSGRSRKPQQLCSSTTATPEIKATTSSFRPVYWAITVNTDGTGSWYFNIYFFSFLRFYPYAFHYRSECMFSLVELDCGLTIISRLPTCRQQWLTAALSVTPAMIKKIKITVV